MHESWDILKNLSTPLHTLACIPSRNFRIIYEWKIPFSNTSCFKDEPSKWNLIFRKDFFITLRFHGFQIKMSKGERKFSCKLKKLQFKSRWIPEHYCIIFSSTNYFHLIFLSHWIFYLCRHISVIIIMEMKFRVKISKSIGID
jgi:hypothetical protein